MPPTAIAPSSIHKCSIEIYLRRKARIAHTKLTVTLTVIAGQRTEQQLIRPLGIPTFLRRQGNN